MRGPVTAGVGIVAGDLGAGETAICKCLSPREGASEGFCIVLLFLTGCDAPQNLLVGPSSESNQTARKSEQLNQLVIHKTQNRA